MSMDDDLQRQQLVAWLRRCDDRAPVELVETHISLLATRGERVYKVRKHVAFPFIDLSTAAARRADCERELRVNRRFAPDVYLGLVDVTDEAGRVIDTAVEMRRMPAERRLATLATHGERAVVCLDQLALDVARIHESAPRGPDIDAAATRDAVAARWRTELDEVARFCGTALDHHVVHDVEGLVERFLAGRNALFSLRIDAGRVCDGHGDLLADDIFCTRDGPRILDAIQFDDRLRWTDTLADVSFLAMDLERLGRRDLARRFLDRYAHAARDRWPASLEGKYVAHRALVRGKVACLRHEQGDPHAAEHARRLLALAWSRLRDSRVRLVLVGGPPGTGKSTLAQRLADREGWTLLRSDVIRKQLAGYAPSEPAGSAFDEGIYAPSYSERTYTTMLGDASSALACGESVVLDASWSDASWRERASEVAATTSSDLIALRCDAPEDVAGARIAERRRIANDASDATVAVATAMRARFAPWPGAHVVDTTRSLDASVAAAVQAAR
jgi:aminoglycoside phosphotransferase family enzyme/predicted kinase